MQSITQMHFCIDANRMIIMAPLQTTHISNLLSLHSVTQNSYNMRIVIAVRMVEKPEKKRKIFVYRLQQQKLVQFFHSFGHLQYNHIFLFNIHYTELKAIKMQVRIIIKSRKKKTKFLINMYSTYRKIRFDFL